MAIIRRRTPWRAASGASDRGPVLVGDESRVFEVATRERPAHRAEPAGGGGRLPHAHERFAGPGNLSRRGGQTVESVHTLSLLNCRRGHLVRPPRQEEAATPAPVTAPKTGVLAHRSSMRGESPSARPGSPRGRRPSGKTRRTLRPRAKGRRMWRAGQELARPGLRSSGGQGAAGRDTSYGTLEKRTNCAPLCGLTFGPGRGVIELQPPGERRDADEPIADERTW